MNKEEINEAIKLIKEPIIVNSVEYKYFSQENYEKLLRVYENCRWFINNYEQVLQNIESLQQKLQRKDNIINDLKSSITDYQEAVGDYQDEIVRKDNNWNELKEWLNYSIEKINEKLKNDKEEIIVKDGKVMNMNDYQILRIKTFRIKMKEVLDKIKELENGNK